MPTSFIKSTIDRRQSSFSGFFLAKSFRIAATSTTGGGAAAPAACVCGALPAAGAPEAAGCVWVPEAPAAGVAWPKILDIRLLNNPITFFFLFLVEDRLLRPTRWSNSFSGRKSHSPSWARPVVSANDKQHWQINRGFAKRER